MTQEKRSIEVKGDYLETGDKIEVRGKYAVGKHIEPGISTEEFQAMLRFLDAVSQRASEFSQALRPAVQAKIIEIDKVRSGPGWTGLALWQLGLSLRSILEGAGGDALAAALLAIWMPQLS